MSVSVNGAPPIPTPSDIAKMRERINTWNSSLDRISESEPNAALRAISAAEARSLINDAEWVLDRIRWAEEARQRAVEERNQAVVEVARLKALLAEKGVKT